MLKLIDHSAVTATISLDLCCEKRRVFQVIHRTQRRVFHQISKHQEVSWKPEAQRVPRCLYIWRSTRWSVWYSFFLEKFKVKFHQFMIIRITHPNLLHRYDFLWFSLHAWIIKVPMKWKIIAACLKAFEKIQRNGVFLFGISVFVLKILTFLCYANEESDDVVNCATKMVKYSIKNISWNIGAVIFKLGTRNVHHLWNKVKSVVPLPRQHAGLQSLSVKF